MNKKSAQIGYFSVWGIIILSIIYFIGLSLLIFVFPKPNWINIKDFFNSISNTSLFLSDLCKFVSFVQTPLILILFACFHDYSSRSLKIFSRISFGFIISFTVLSTLSYFVQFTITRFNINYGNYDCLEHFTQSNFHAFISSVNVLAWTIHIGLASLFLIPIFSVSKIEHHLKIGLLIIGIFSLISSLLYIMDKPKIFALCMLLSSIAFIYILILCLKFFKQFIT